VYAALDVELLVDVREIMGTMLADADKATIAEEEFAAVLARDLKPVREQPWRRLSGLHSIRGLRNLAVARELWLARDAYAREIDTAPGRLVPDSALVAAARTLPETKRDLVGLKEFTGRASRSQIDRWWNAIQTGLTTEDMPVARVSGEVIPPPRVWSDKNPDADKRLKAARAALTEVSTEINIPLENVLTPELLRRLAWKPPADISAESVSTGLAEMGARPWQVTAVAETIYKAFVDSSQTTETTDDTAS